MRDARTDLAAVGLAPADERLYQRVLPHSGRTVGACATALEVDVEQLRARLDPLLAIGAVEIRDGTVHVRPPATLLADRLGQETDALRRSAAHLDQLGDAIGALRDLALDPLAGGEPAGADLLEGGDVPALLESWIRNSTGELRWLRPDQWSLPSESPMRSAVAAAIRDGRRCRAIYPARALEEAPQALLERVAVGEEVRIVAQVPSRMAIIGGSGALVPELWGEHNDRRIRVRQPGLQAALTLLFDEMWDRGIALRGRAGARGSLEAEQSRRLLLEQLAGGARDEQVARALGVSLRTVRRRVADLLLELGVDSRFQAGVEAVRRGLL